MRIKASSIFDRTAPEHLLPPDEAGTAARGGSLGTAQAHARANGKKIGRHVKYGYRADDGQLVPVATEQEVITQVVQMRRPGKTLQAIADTLNRDDTPTRLGGAWRHGIVRKLVLRHSNHHGDSDNGQQENQKP